MSWPLIFEHLFIVVSASLLSVCIGLPLGILAYVSKTARPILLRLVDLLQTVPSLALLGILMVFFSPGKGTVIAGITLYSLLPIVRNTCLGLEQVDPGIKEAARGMGMGKARRILTVELPLAFPTAFTGIRIAVVNAIGTAVFAAFVGGGGLGGVITQAIRVSDMRLILCATGALMVMAAALDAAMGFLERKLRTGRNGRRGLGLFAAGTILLFCLLLPYGQSATGDLILYDGDYSEPQLLHRMVKLLVEDGSDLRVIILDQMSQVNNFNALTAPSPTCDLMLSYDGTLLTTFFHQDTTDIPEGESLYAYVRRTAQEKYGLRLLDPLGFDNTYAVAVPQAVADHYGLATISDLAAVAPGLTFGAEQGFFTMEGSMKFTPFTQFYGLHFQNIVSIDLGLKYAAVENGTLDVTVVYATDGLNRKVGLHLLEDDRHFFPDYRGAFLVRGDVLERYPQLEDILGQLSGRISTDQMAELSYQVDVEGRSADDVARAFLTEQGLLKP